MTNYIGPEMPEKTISGRFMIATDNQHKIFEKKMLESLAGCEIISVDYSELETRILARRRGQCKSELFTFDSIHPELFVVPAAKKKTKAMPWYHGKRRF